MLLFPLRRSSGEQLTLAAAVHDHIVSTLVVARLVSTGRLSPRRDRMASARGLTFTTTVRMVDRVHDHATVGRADAHPARASRLADADVLVIKIADLTDGRHAVDQNFARLARRQFDERVVTFFGDQ